MLYVGATRNLKERIKRHRSGNASLFTKKYHLNFLMYFEECEDVKLAFVREKQLKRWHKEWKWNLIKENNPTLKDLFNEIE